MKTPNIILITTDQQRFDTIQSYGAPTWTPHLNWLVDNGITFTRAYSDCPVCMPARLSIMAGMPAWKHGVLSNRYQPGALDPEQTLPAALQRAGYQTRLFGKHHHGPSTRHLMGFAAQETITHYDQYLRDVGLPDRSAHGIGGNEHVPGFGSVPFEHSLASWIVERACRFMEHRDPDMPFFTWLSFNKPHPPLDVSPEVMKMYEGSPITGPITAEWSRRDSAQSERGNGLSPAWHAVTDELSMTGRLQDWQLLQLRRAYYAAVTEVDLNLGKLFGYLTARGLLEDTWIIFTSDHGEMLGDHGMGGKCVPFEGSAHVPLIVRPPFSRRDYRSEPRRGTESPALVTLPDISRTIAELGQAETFIPDSATVNLLSAGEQGIGRRQVYGNCMYLHYLLNERLKYCYESLDHTELLFDLSNDPEERRDLSGDANYRSAIETMRGEVQSHMKETERVVKQLDAQTDPGVLVSTDTTPRNTQPGHPKGLRP